MCYSLTPKPICGDLPQQPNSERRKASFAVGTSVGCSGGSCKTSGRVIATFLRLPQRVPCIPADVQAFSLALKNVFLPDLARNSRKPTLLDMFLWRLIPVISWASDGGWRNVLPHRSHLLTVHTAGTPILFPSCSSDYFFDCLCCPETRFFYCFENLQLNLIEIWFLQR